MSWTSFDQPLGWIHSLRLNRNNYFLGGRFGTNQRPYPIIVNKPSFPQVVDNWNSADTGLVVAFFVAGLFIARRVVRKQLLNESIIEKRNDYRRFHRIVTAFGIAMALRNSSYRLEGYVPNGLPKQNTELVKYDFTSEIISSTFWRFFIESHDKPSSN